MWGIPSFFFNISNSDRLEALAAVQLRPSLFWYVTWSRLVDSSWNVMARGDAPEGKWRGNWRMEWVAGTLHTTSEHGVSSIITADTHTSAASSRPNWRPHRFKWTCPFRRKTKSGFCACAITFILASTWLPKFRYILSGPSETIKPSKLDQSPT